MKYKKDIKVKLKACPRNLIFLTKPLDNEFKTYKFENCQIFAINILEFSLYKEIKPKNVSIPQNPH